MKVFYRIIAVLLAITMLAAFAGCNDDKTASSSKNTSKTSSAVSGNNPTQSYPSQENPSAYTPSQGSNQGGLQGNSTSMGTKPTPTGNDNGTLIVYPEYDKRIMRDYAYDVKVVQGSKSQSLTCYNHCEAVSTSVRTVNGDMYRRFCEFAFSDSAVRVDITVKTDFNYYTVMPSAKNFKSTRYGNVISVYLDKPEYFMLKLDRNDDSILAVFADKPETDAPKKGDSNVLYIDGWYDESNDKEGYLINDKKQLVIDKANTTVYLAPGAVLNARIKINANYVTVKGRGMILDPYSNTYKTDITKVDSSEAYYFFLVEGDYCTINGIKLIDSRHYNLWVNGKALKCSNTKIMSTRLETDGITTRLDGGHDINHCFVYVGDNALVLAGVSSQTKLTDITVGSYCCAIFPQNAAGGTNDYYKINNIYVFRCDEGLMRNCFNWNSSNQTFKMTLNNVSAVDVDHFPWIFYGYKMGTGAKNITFNNLAVPSSTGSNTLGSGDGTEILITNQTLATNNYTLTFNGLTINGKAITSASQLKQNITANNRINVTGNGSSFGPATSAKKHGTFRVRGKIYIGHRLLYTKLPAVNQNGEWYVPAEEVSKAVFRPTPTDTVNINGNKYIAISKLASSGIARAASYSDYISRIDITPPSNVSGNLFTVYGNEIHTHWSEYAAHNTHIIPISGYSGDAFRLQYCGANAGIGYNLTDLLKQYGTGNYILTFTAKADKSAGLKAIMCTNRIKSTLEQETLTTGWKIYTIAFNYSTSPTDFNNAAILFTPTVASAGVEIRNMSLIYNGK